MTCARMSRTPGSADVPAALSATRIDSAARGIKSDRPSSTWRVPSIVRSVPRETRGAYDPESDAVRIGVRRNLMAVRTAEHRHVVVHTRAAPDDSHVARPGAGRIPHFASAVIVRVVPVGHPFPDVPGHVVEPVRVRRVGPGRTRALLTFGRRIGEEIASRSVDDIVPGYSRPSVPPLAAFSHSASVGSPIARSIALESHRQYASASS